MDSIACSVQENSASIATVFTMITAFLAACAAAISAMMAWKQREISKKMLGTALEQQKTTQLMLKANLYDKQKAIYDTVCDFIRDVKNEGALSDKNLHKFNRSTDQAKFLFGNDVVVFIGELHERARRASHWKEKNDANKENDELDWIQEQIRINVDDLFRPYLGFETTNDIKL